MIHVVLGSRAQIVYPAYPRQPGRTTTGARWSSSARYFL